METDQRSIAKWRYYVRDGKVFCPRRTADVDLSSCSSCVYLTSDPSGGFVVCLPPAGNSVAEMIDTVAWY